MAGLKPFSYGHFGIVPDPPEYPEYDGCEYGYAQVDEGDECIGCVWYETCKKVMKE